VSSQKRIVIKVGTSTLTNDNGNPNPEYIRTLAADVQELTTQGLSPILVSSGAIAAGMQALKLHGRPRTIPQKQAAAAVGQGLLMHLYSTAFESLGLTVAQMLLTKDDLIDRKRYINASNTLNALLKLNAIPIINENDTIAVNEIRVGDNDTLAAMVAGLADASALVILSDVDGLYTENPLENPDAELIRVVKRIDRRIEALAGEAGTTRGTGGMRTKINAAKICARSAVTMYIANGKQSRVIQRSLAGEIGSKFLPSTAVQLKSKKRWIAFGSASSGTVTINPGATRQIIYGGKSLLPAGIIDVTGAFAMGDMVLVNDEAGTPVARGIVNYSAESLRLIMGKQSTAIEETLGIAGPDEAVHRDNLVLTGQVLEARS
jgi:glutamate 5-kinase